MVTYVIDRGLDSLLTAVFESFERRHPRLRLSLQGAQTIDMFGETVVIEADLAKAERVWKAFLKKVHPEEAYVFYRAFLSEDLPTHEHLLRYMIDLFRGVHVGMADFGNEDVLAISQMARKVDREQHRMKAFVRFRLSAEGLYMARIKPDFNVLPLIVDHFRKRFADQPWWIFDEGRGYGAYFDLERVTALEASDLADEGRALDPGLWDGHEAHFAQLWNDYFHSTCINERKNPRLHLKHVPLRYWGYLTEKASFFQYYN